MSDNDNNDQTQDQSKSQKKKKMTNPANPDIPLPPADDGDQPSTPPPPPPPKAPRKIRPSLIGRKKAPSPPKDNQESQQASQSQAPIDQEGTTKKRKKPRNIFEDDDENGGESTTFCWDFPVNFGSGDPDAEDEDDQFGSLSDLAGELPSIWGIISFKASARPENGNNNDTEANGESAGSKKNPPRKSLSIGSRKRSAEDADDESNELPNKLRKIQQEIDDYNKTENSHMDVRDQILLLDCDLYTKSLVLKKYDDIQRSSSEYSKFMPWIRSILKIPFAKYVPTPVKFSDGSTAIRDYLNDVRKRMDIVVSGHDQSKTEIVDYVARLISNPDSRGNVLALCGPRGCGKTRLVKRGIADALGRPFHVINFGGLNDVNLLTGHDLTYVSSKFGRIAQILIQSKCMNPVIYLDEIDKIGDLDSGKTTEIFGVLTHLLDEEQNAEFQDNYFQGIKLDLSKVLFVVSFNHLENVDYVVRDRLKIIHVPSTTTEQKISIVNDHVLPELFTTIGIGPEAVKFSDETIKYIIGKTEKEDGVRQLKKNIETVLQRLNTQRITRTGLFESATCVELTPENVGSYIPKDERGNEEWRNIYL